MSWQNVTTDDEHYRHIHTVLRDEESDDVLVIERQEHPWLEEPEYHVRKTPEPESSKILDTLGKKYNSLDEAIARAEEHTGVEIPHEYSADSDTDE